MKIEFIDENSVFVMKIFLQFFGDLVSDEQGFVIEVDFVHKSKVRSRGFLLISDSQRDKIKNIVTVNLEPGKLISSFFAVLYL